MRLVECSLPILLVAACANTVREKPDASFDAPPVEATPPPDVPIDPADDAGPPEPRCPRRPCLSAPILRAAEAGTWLVQPDGRTFYWGTRSVAGVPSPGPSTRFETPTAGPRLSRDVLDAAASGSHVCALLGYPLRVVCWGDDAAGQLGRGDDGDPAVPGVVPGLSGVEAVAALPQESWALTHAGSFSWGNVRQPAGNRVATPAPQQMRSAPPNAVRFATGLSAHGWGYLTADGEIFAFGSGGSFANGSERAEMITVPTRVAGISAAVDYSVSNMTSCAVLASGTVYCWGARGYFLPPTPDRPFDAWPPERVAGIDDAVRVYLGSDFACALTRTHQVRCWGRVNRDPENNHGTAVIAAAGPAMSLPPVRELMVSYSHACALTLDGDVYCWGDNDLSQLGVRGLPRNSSAPVFVFHPR